MASQLKTLELWDTLEPAGGVRKAVISDWMSVVETQREDGNDSLEVSYPLSLPIATSVTNGWAVRLVGEDGSIREYIVYIILDILETDTQTLTCAGARTIMSSWAVGDGSGGLVGAGSGTTADLWAFVSGRYPIPAWLTLGTATDTISTPFTLTPSGDTVLTLFQKGVQGVDAQLPSGAAPCIWAFRPVVSGASVTGYKVDILITATTGTAHLLKDKNINKLQRRRDTTDPTYPVTSYVVEVLDRYRDRPDLFPYDNLTPFQTCRLEWPPLGIDTAIRIVAVTTNYETSLGTTVELGSPKRRQPQMAVDTAAAVTTVASTVAALPPAAIIVSVVPVSVSSTQAVMRVYAATPAAAKTVTVTYTAQPSGLGISPASGQTFSGATTLGATGYKDFTITREAFGGDPSTVTFTCSADGHLDTSATIGIETVADLASATKSVRVAASDFVPCGPYSRFLNTDGSIQSDSGASLEQYASAVAFPEGVTITGMTANVLGNSGYTQCVLIRDDSSVVGSSLNSSGGSFADVSQTLSENVGTGGSAHRYAIWVYFNGGSVPADRQIKYVTFTYTSPSIQNTY